MSAEDKIERILKQIHILLAEGESPSGSPDKVIIDKSEVFPVLEELNIAMYELMDQYEATTQARELAQRRSEKKGEEMIERVTKKAEDIYAASLIYTDDALNKIHSLMEDAMNSAQRIWDQASQEMEKEKRKVKEDQLELREQLQDFKDSNKYLAMMEDCNREREKQEKEANAPEKKIQNEAKHYPAKSAPEIKVNAAYFERRERKLKEEKGEAFDVPEIKVDLDSEYFKWKNGEAEKPDKKNAVKKKLVKVKKKLMSLIEQGL